jgi:hypothetical protein
MMKAYDEHRAGIGGTNDLRGLKNLNDAVIDDTGYGEAFYEQPHRKHPMSSNGITAVFDRHTEVLCEEIRAWPAVIGCMAWLTNADILTALRGRDVCIIIQKEDWLRPDSGGWTKQRLRSLYQALDGINKHVFNTGYGTLGDEGHPPVMCCGIIGSQAQVTPRMHHKFLVFGDYICHGGSKAFMPRAVWTGSFNATYNATQSLENAVLIRDPVHAATFYEEWRTILGIAEPLDWNQTWIASDHRIGT